MLAISGSLRAHSTNTNLLRAVKLLAPPQLHVAVYDALASIPPFNPDLDVDPAPIAVGDLRRAVQDASALIFSTPEYAHGVPGTLKNALDWLVGSGELSEKPVVLVHASARGRHARNSLKEILATMNGRLIDDAEFILPLMGTALEPIEIANDPQFAAVVRLSMQKIEDCLRLLQPEPEGNRRT